MSEERRAPRVRQDGKEPLTVRLTPEARRILREKAGRLGIAQSAWLELAIREHEQGKKPKE